MTDSMSEVVERLARAVYARNGWWRLIKDDDDGRGRYHDSGDTRLRAVEWEELSAEERVQHLLDIRAALDELSAMGLVVVPVEPTEGMVRAMTALAPTWDDETSRRKWAAAIRARAAMEAA